VSSIRSIAARWTASYLIAVVAVDALFTAYSTGFRQRNYAPLDARVLALFLIVFLMLPVTYAAAVPVAFCADMVRKKIRTAAQRYATAVVFGLLLVCLFALGASRTGVYERIIFP
jgi:di/tricarboxylate transporter